MDQSFSTGAISPPPLVGDEKVLRGGEIILGSRGGVELVLGGREGVLISFDDI